MKKVAAPSIPSRQKTENGKMSVKNEIMIIGSYYGIIYAFDAESKWQAILQDYTKINFVDNGGDLDIRYQIMAVQSDSKLMNYCIKSSTKASIKGNFVKWNDDSKTHGARFAKTNVAQQFFDQLSALILDLSPYAKVNKIRDPEKTTIDGIPAQEYIGKMSTRSADSNGVPFENNVPFNTEFIAQDSSVKIDVLLANGESRQLSMDSDLSVSSLLDSVCKDERLNASFYTVYYNTASNTSVPFSCKLADLDNYQLKLVDKKALHKSLSIETQKFMAEKRNIKKFSQSVRDERASSPSKMDRDYLLNVNEPLVLYFLDLANIHKYELNRPRVHSIVEEFIAERGGIVYLKQVRDSKLSRPVLDEIGEISQKVTSLCDSPTKSDHDIHRVISLQEEAAYSEPNFDLRRAYSLGAVAPSQEMNKLKAKSALKKKRQAPLPPGHTRPLVHAGSMTSLNSKDEEDGFAKPSLIEGQTIKEKKRRAPQPPGMKQDNQNPISPTPSALSNASSTGSANETTPPASPYQQVNSLKSQEAVNDLSRRTSSSSTSSDNQESNIKSPPSFLPPPPPSEPPPEDVSSPVGPLSAATPSPSKNFQFMGELAKSLEARRSLIMSPENEDISDRQSPVIPDDEFETEIKSPVTNKQHFENAQMNSSSIDPQEYDGLSDDAQPDVLSRKRQKTNDTIEISKGAGYTVDLLENQMKTILNSLKLLEDVRDEKQKEMLIKPLLLQQTILQKMIEQEKLNIVAKNYELGQEIESSSEEFSETSSEIVEKEDLGDKSAVNSMKEIGVPVRAASIGDQDKEPRKLLKVSLDVTGEALLVEDSKDDNDTRELERLRILEEAEKQKKLEEEKRKEEVERQREEIRRREEEKFRIELERRRIEEEKRKHDDEQREMMRREEERERKEKEKRKQEEEEEKRRLAEEKLKLEEEIKKQKEYQRQKKMLKEIEKEKKRKEEEDLRRKEELQRQEEIQRLETQRKEEELRRRMEDERKRKEEEEAIRKIEEETKRMELEELKRKEAENKKKQEAERLELERLREELELQKEKENERLMKERQEIEELKKQLKEQREMQEKETLERERLMEMKEAKEKAQNELRLKQNSEEKQLFKIAKEISLNEQDIETSDDNLKKDVLKCSSDETPTKDKKVVESTMKEEKSKQVLMISSSFNPGGNIEAPIVKSSELPVNAVETNFVKDSSVSQMESKPVPPRRLSSNIVSSAMRSSEVDSTKKPVPNLYAKIQQIANARAASSVSLTRQNLPLQSSSNLENLSDKLSKSDLSSAPYKKDHGKTMGTSNNFVTEEKSKISPAVIDEKSSHNDNRAPSPPQPKDSININPIIVKETKNEVPNVKLNEDTKQSSRLGYVEAKEIVRDKSKKNKEIANFSVKSKEDDATSERNYKPFPTPIPSFKPQVFRPTSSFMTKLTEKKDNNSNSANENSTEVKETAQTVAGSSTEAVRTEPVVRTEAAVRTEALRVAEQRNETEMKSVVAVTKNTQFSNDKKDGSGKKSSTEVSAKTSLGTSIERDMFKGKEIYLPGIDKDLRITEASTNGDETMTSVSVDEIDFEFDSGLSNYRPKCISPDDLRSTLAMKSPPISTGKTTSASILKSTVEKKVPPKTLPKSVPKTLPKPNMKQGNKPIDETRRESVKNRVQTFSQPIGAEKKKEIVNMAAIPNRRIEISSGSISSSIMNKTISHDDRKERSNSKTGERARTLPEVPKDGQENATKSEFPNSASLQTGSVATEPVQAPSLLRRLSQTAATTGTTNLVTSPREPSPQEIIRVTDQQKSKVSEEESKSQSNDDKDKNDNEPMRIGNYASIREVNKNEKSERDTVTVKKVGGLKIGFGRDKPKVFNV